MGWETPTFGSPKAIPAIKRDLAKRKGRWLPKAAKATFNVTLDDWQFWRRKYQSSASSK